MGFRTRNTKRLLKSVKQKPDDIEFYWETPPPPPLEGTAARIYDVRRVSQFEISSGGISRVIIAFVSYPFSSRWNTRHIITQNGNDVRTLFNSPKNIRTI